MLLSLWSGSPPSPTHTLRCRVNTWTEAATVCE